MAREGQRGKNGDKNGKGGGRRKQRGRWGTRSKMSPLVNDVLEYWESYKGDGAD